MRSPEPIRPFLKWPGGKYRLLERISLELAPGKRLVEPFVGSGAVFLNTSYQRYLLADSNADLINLFRQLKRRGREFIEQCREYFGSAYNCSERYYQLRNDFNRTDDDERRAVLFVYLNRHCYNGLCRFNAKGGFNTPFGRYRQPYFPEREMLRFAARARRARIEHAAFRRTMERAVNGDVVYCDPPYAPLSPTANFTDYSAGGFGWAQQREVAELARDLANRGVPVIISNHATDEVRALYRGAKLIEFPVRRTISCQHDKRELVSELLAVFPGKKHEQ
jgi:DNA adenine methylase